RRRGESCGAQSIFLSQYNFALVAYVAIVFLTLVLVIMNVHSVVLRFLEDRNGIRLYSYLGTILVVGSLIIAITNNVVDHVIDSELVLHEGGTIAAAQRV